MAVNAASSAPSSFVSVDPTRILDTRTDVGLSGPFVSGVAQKLQVTGTVSTQPPGDADPVDASVVPSTATSVVVNVTVVKPTTKGFLSIRPGDATGTPATSNINWAAGGPNIANAVTVQLPASGEIDIFVNGTVGEVLIDVAGYHVPAASGPKGDKGDQGEQGEQGNAAWDVIPSGTTVTGNVGWQFRSGADNQLHNFAVPLPGTAPVPLTTTDVNFSLSGAPTSDDDLQCTGTAEVPTAPAGKLCLYLYGSVGADDIVGEQANNVGDRAFYVQWLSDGVGDMFVFATWAYTAP